MSGTSDIPADRFVVLDGVRFHYLDWGGHGDPLLLLAGMGCTAHIFVELAPQLTDRYRVVALTRRGHGLTERAASGHGLADGAEDARRLLDHLDIERAHVVGHSMGGGEVSELAARHPQRVARIVYLDGAYDWADRPATQWPEEEGPDRFASYRDYVDFIHTLLPDEVQGPAFDAMLPTTVEVAEDGSVVDTFSGATAAPYLEALRTFRHPYADIAAPALALYALGDQWAEPEAASWRIGCRDRFAAETADARVIELRGTHYLFLDQRDAVLSALHEFLG